MKDILTIQEIQKTIKKRITMLKKYRDARRGIKKKEQVKIEEAAMIYWLLTGEEVEQ